ncbi:MAG: tetratricopeptide repeat protein, partial [Dehalococcoidia bacterium]
YYAAAEYTEAIKLFREILTARTRVLGASHPDTLRSLGSLANNYRAAGQHRQAARLHKKALASRQRTLGADHPSTRASQRNLAASLRASRETENDPPSP